MSPPVRIVSAVVATALAGDASCESGEALSPSDRGLTESVRARLRSGRSRAAAAAAIVAAQASLARPGELWRDPSLGARVYARWLRACDPAARASVARRLDDPTAAAVSAVRAPAFEGPLVATAAYVVACGARHLGRLPTARELGACLALARGAVDVREPAVVRWERSIRVAGRHAALVALGEATG